MKVSCKEFRFPQKKFVEVVKYGGFWRDKRYVEKEAVRLTFEDVVKQVTDFATSIGPDRLINICEFTTARKQLGDDGDHWFVVWYWEEEQVEEVKPVSDNGSPLVS